MRHCEVMVNRSAHVLFDCSKGIFTIKMVNNGSHQFDCSKGILSN